MNTRNPGYCFQCDDGTVLKPTTRDVTITAAHITKIAPKITGGHCPKCDEIEFCDKDSSARFSAVLDEAWTEARAEEAQNIRCIRKKPGQKQAEAGRLFGGGVNAGKQTAVVTALERKSRLYLTAFVPDRRARMVSDTLITLLAPYQQQQMVKTITADNGREFSEHIRIAQHLDCAFYFADPYASWQRGSNEHHNGLLRRFFPKGTDFACVPETALQTATPLINLWPRKNLNGLCPLDMISASS
ncbi:hypothetical protein AGMMS49545_07400 [Betaproteobacteria bacterium]|nr:hypothetical protein AGMMS49545_07400 [Betaproteobacteria bacterium]